MNFETSRTLSVAQWGRLAQAHQRRAAEWTEPYRARSARGEMHPIYDFLFLYYRIKPSQLEAWHPGIDQALELREETNRFSDRYYTRSGEVLHLDPAKLDESSRHRMRMALQLCEVIQDRPPQFGCSGMHEWAMVYRGDTEGEIRHAESLPLRLSQKETDAFVRSRPIRCSHFDAFRFFSPSAKAFNRLQPTKKTRIETEQCGCLHTNMDLYKLCGQSSPWVGSELLWKSFELALEARVLDMRASPYDCRSLGYTAVPVETPEGRHSYERQQRELSERASPIRSELIRRLRKILDRAEHR